MVSENFCDVFRAVQLDAQDLKEPERLILAILLLVDEMAHQRSSLESVVRELHAALVRHPRNRAPELRIAVSNSAPRPSAAPPPPLRLVGMDTGVD
jgi:hypothetical protein